MKPKRILIIGNSEKFCLEQSYVRAANQLNHEVIFFDLPKEGDSVVRMGKLGRTLHSILPVEAWVKKMNRRLIVLVKESNPDYIFLFTSARVLYGTLVTIKLIQPVKIVWFWPDTPMNLSAHSLHNATLFDISAIYSREAAPLFQKLGFFNVRWIALAGDPLLHYMEPPDKDNYRVDLSFVGAWRPERERVISFIASNFPQINLELYGNYWKRDCTEKSLLKHWKGQGIFGKDLGAYFNQSRINLNVIDDTNYPAANMRFFEIITAGGLQLVNNCPEMSQEFRDREHVIYFQNENGLGDQIEWVLNNPVLCQNLRIEGQKTLLESHTYSHRLESILRLL